MNAKLIKTDGEHVAALKRIDDIFNALPGTPEADELELLVHLVEEYEEQHYPIDPPDPIEAIKFRMEQSNLTAKDLVPFLGSKSKVSEILSRKRSLSLTMIRKLHKGLAIPADVLLREPGQVLSPLYEGIDWNMFPLREMIKREWFPKFSGRARDLREQAEEILGPMLFPNGRDCRELDMVARSSSRTGCTPNDYSLWAWQARVLQLGTGDPLGTYKPEAMTKELMRSVVNMSTLDDGPIQARRLLGKNGIAVVILRSLPGTHLDGAAMLNSDGRPVIALTLRHDRLDNFWFTMAHEMAHIVLHLSKGDNVAFLDDLEHLDSSDNKEAEADNVATELLIAKRKWSKAKLTLTSTNSRIRDLAAKTHVHPAIVAGRIRFENNNYKKYNDLVGCGSVRRLFPAYQAGDID